MPASWDANLFATDEPAASSDALFTFNPVDRRKAARSKLLTDFEPCIRALIEARFVFIEVIQHPTILTTNPLGLLVKKIKIRSLAQILLCEFKRKLFQVFEHTLSICLDDFETPL